MSQEMLHGGTHELVHWLAAFVLVIGGGIFLGLAAFQRLAKERQGGDVRSAGPVASPAVAQTDALDRSIIRIVAGLSLGAAAIHLAAAPHHYAELGDLGAGFLVAGVFQAVWARAALGAPTRRTAWIGIVVNLAIVAAWIISRSIGLPSGPGPWSPEAIGLPDGASTIFELLILAGLTIRLLGADRAPVATRRHVRSIAAIAVIPALGLVLITTSLAAVAIAAGVDHGPAHVSPAGVAEHAMVSR